MKKACSVFTAIFTLLAVFTLSFHHALAADGLTKIGDGVYSYVDTRNATPANSYGSNAGIIIGKDGIVVVDTLISAKLAKKFISDIRAVSDKPILYVVNTHYHLDHTFGNAEFRKLGAIIISHKIDKADMEKNGENTLKNYKDHGLTDKDMEGTTLAYPTLSFTDRMEIDLGSRKAELIYPGPSHTAGSIMVFVPDQKILFAGDILFTNYHPYIAEGDLEGWAKALDYIEKMDVAKIIPGHGPVSDKRDVQDMKEYLVAFDEKAKQLCAGSKDVDHIVSEIKKSLPGRAETEVLIRYNILRRYVKK